MLGYNFPKDSFTCHTKLVCRSISIQLADSLAHLLCACTEHALYTETHRCDIHGRTPVLVQDGETDVPIAIDVRVDRNVLANKSHLQDTVELYRIDRGTKESNLWRIKWVFGVEFKL